MFECRSKMENWAEDEPSPEKKSQIDAALARIKELVAQKLCND